jgi:hypothetical protein
MTVWRRDEKAIVDGFEGPIVLTVADHKESRNGPELSGVGHEHLERIRNANEVLIRASATPYPSNRRIQSDLFYSTQKF